MNPPTDPAVAVLEPARRAAWRYIGVLAPVVLLWAALAGWLAWQLADRAHWSDESDAAIIREWIEEARPFRRALPDMVAEYASIPAAEADRRDRARREIGEQIRAMIEPTVKYASQLPSFPAVHRLVVELPGETEPVGWLSPVPRPRSEQYQTLRLHPVQALPEAAIVCDYRLHAFNRLQQQEANRWRTYAVAGVLLATATVLAGLFVWRFIRREHDREIDRLHALATSRQRERDLLREKLAREESELAAQDARSKLVEAENANLEMKSQMYAHIGVMAGSYAHNIKNLLVRPNDLLARCLEVDGLSPQQEGMLSEVRSTLGTVTERLQQILRTVRRDPMPMEAAPIDLCRLVDDIAAAWRDTANDKWKLNLGVHTDPGPIEVLGDTSNLQQALENLLFNARDATFEMRNLLRDEARAETDADRRRERLLAAAAWRGEVTLILSRTGSGAVLEVRDNGIGMTEEVKANCLRTHFSTKRDNALYEGYTAGMGLGLSFVAMVLERHNAALTIESAPRAGACFRMLFPDAPLAPNPDGR